MHASLNMGLHFQNYLFFSVHFSWRHNARNDNIPLKEYSMPSAILCFKWHVLEKNNHGATLSHLYSNWCN